MHIKKRAVISLFQNSAKREEGKLEKKPSLIKVSLMVKGVKQYVISFSN